ncbi:MAG: CoA transferase [Myxococcota bacterium]|jgi:crotonobetainyl-CoA:carnitine CoA-transferase CaiB-like acyl-CoA transferase|nr:CoA transferase [Myxococcota bacterium]
MQPLRGLRVVDLADENGELCGRLLADLGAEVIRVEPPGGAVSRDLPPFAPDGRTSLYFGFRNLGKRSRVIDLESPDGRSAFEALLAEADILIESNQPGRLAELGLGATDLLERHPHLVVTSISDFGQDGPYAGYQSTNMVAVAMGGMMYRAGIPEKPPVMIPGSFAYDVASGSAAYATLLAFWKRLQTGRGQHIDVSAMDAVANLSDWSLPNFSLNPTVGTRMGSGIYTLYRCADGYVRMIVLVLRHWRALVEWVGSPEELMNPDYDQFINRLVALDQIVPVLEGFFRDKNKVEIAREAQKRGIPATPLLHPGEVLGNEHAVGRETFASVSIGSGFEAKVPSGFLTIEGARVGPVGGAPELGEAGDEGFSRQEDRTAFEGVFASPSGASPDGYPLRGLRVIDFGVGAVGVEAARLLAEYGADVIKIETSDAPDFIRVIMSSYMNPSFASSNRTKRSFGVNVKNEKGRELVRRLVKDADFLIENNGTGAIERMGFGPDDLRELNPRMISFSSQLVGSYGPWKDWIGYGPNTHPVSGLQYLWNYPEDADRPAGSTAVYPDHFVGRIGAMTLMAGLIARERTGQGSHHDSAQFEVAIGLLGDLFARESLDPGSVVPEGNASTRGAPWGCYRCADDEQEEWCVITVRDDEEWSRLKEVLGHPAWSEEVSYHRADGRMAARKAIDEGVQAWTRQRSPREVMEALQAVGVPSGIVAHPGHHMSDPQMIHRDYAKPVEQQELSTVLLEGPAFLGSDLPEVITEQAPLIGEHTREVASELLGLSREEVETMLEEGTLEDPPPEFRLV